MSRIIDISECMLLLGLDNNPTEIERAVVNFSLMSAEGAIRRYLKYDPVRMERTEYYPGSMNPQTGPRVLEANDDFAYERTLASDAADKLQIQHVPIRSISSVRVDYDGRFGTRSGSFGASSAWTEGQDFFPEYDGNDGDGNPICRSGLILSEGRWPTTAGAVKIVYTAGFSADEFRGQSALVDATPIHEAVIDEVTRRVQKHYSRMKSRRRGWAGPLSSESLGDYSYSADSATFARLVGAMYDILPETESKLQDFINYGYMLAG